MPVTSILGTNLLVSIALMFCVWLLSLPKKDVSIVDGFWGLGFVLIAWITFFTAEGYAGRRLLLSLLTTVWGLRLAAHIFWRNRGKGEDPRYAAMRQTHGEKFKWVSLFTVFGLQAVLLWVVSLVVQVGQLSRMPSHFTWLEVLGTGIWAVGFFFEAVGDWQLARFKADPANEHKIMDRGLWACTRHPNYFGESLIWWGMFLIALSTHHGIWGLISPLVITFLLLKVSGVTLTEKTILDVRPEYSDYIERTSAFVPWFPKRKKAREV